MSKIKHVTRFLFIFTLFSAVSCSPAVETEATRPDDFSLTYHWQEGSLPPPYHYEYSITIQPDGEGLIEMIPDYQSENTPVWTEIFTVTPADLDRLYQVLTENHFFKTNWTALTSPPIGGSSERLTVTALGRETDIPSFVLPEQQEAAMKS